MTDDEWVEKARRLLDVSMHPLTKEVCQELIDRLEVGRVPRRGFDRRKYQRELMRKRRAAAKAKVAAAVPTVIDDENISLLDD